MTDSWGARPAKRTCLGRRALWVTESSASLVMNRATHGNWRREQRAH